jgi:hypothetical protein
MAQSTQQHVCLKPRPVMEKIYGKTIGRALFHVIQTRKRLNDYLGIKEQWYSFTVVDDRYVLLSSYQVSANSVAPIRA